MRHSPRFSAVVFNVFPKRPGKFARARVLLGGERRRRRRRTDSEEDEEEDSFPFCMPYVFLSNVLIIIIFYSSPFSTEEEDDDDDAHVLFQIAATFLK